jgi:hypothetical protein
MRYTFGGCTYMGKAAKMISKAIFLQASPTPAECLRLCIFFLLCQKRVVAESLSTRAKRYHERDDAARMDARRSIRLRASNREHQIENTTRVAFAGLWIEAKLLPRHGRVWGLEGEPGEAARP